jgi:outer membrane protein assembly complex protein YaeT
MTVRATIRLIARRVALVALAAGLGVAILLMAVHLPWVEARVGEWAASQLATRGILIQTSALTYNLATRRVHVEGLVVSTTADTRQPFLQADRLDVLLPRSVLAGRFAIASLSGERVRVVLERRQDGSTNFPQDQSAGASGVPASFPIDQLALSNASIAWRDDVFGMGATADALSVELDRGSGNIVLGRPATLRVGDHETSFTADARIGWDGARLSFESLRLDAPEVTLRAAGTVGLAAGRPLTIDGDGSADLDRLAAWFAPGQRPSGRVAFRAHATGSAADPTADVTLTAPNFAWQGLTGASIEASMHVDRRALDAGRFTVRALGGTATGRGRVALSRGPAGSATEEQAHAAFDWHDIDAGKLLAALGGTAPVRIGTLVGTLVDGHLAASWTAWKADALTGELEATTRISPRTRQGPTDARWLGLGGKVTLGARAGEWHGTMDQWIDRAVHVEGRADGRLAPASLADSTVGGTLVATADSLPDLWRTLHTLDLAAGSPPSTLTGSARADVTLSGRVGNPRLAGRVEATLPALDQLGADVQPNLRLTGQLSLSATVSGTVTVPLVDGRLSGESLSFAGQHADRLDASFGVAEQAVRVEPLVLTQPDGRLTVNGRYDLRTNAVTGRLTASHLMVDSIPGAQPGEILVPLRARLDGEWDVAGTVADPHGSGQVEFSETTAFDREVGRVSTRLTLADHQLRAAIELADLSTTGTATLALASPGAFVVDAQTRDGDLATLISRLRVAISTPVTGHASLAAHVEGVREDIAHARATVDLQRLEAAVGEVDGADGVTVRSTEPGRASYDGRTLDVTGVALDIFPGGSSGRTELRAAGRLGADIPGTLAASLNGQASDLQQLALIFLPAGSPLARVQVDGLVRIAVRAPGTLDQPALNAEASLDEGRIALADQPQATSFTVRASYDAGVLNVSRLEATWQAATVSATGDIPIALVAPDAPLWLTGSSGASKGAGRLQARFDSVTPAVLAPFVPAATVSRLAGLASGTLTLDADRPVLAAVHGQLVLDQASLAVAGVPFNQQRPTRIEVADGRVRIAAWDWGGEDNRLSLGGSVQLEGAPALDISANGTIDLRVLGAFLPDVTTGGRGMLTARVTGAPGDPQLDGRIELQRGELRVTSPRLVISDLTGSLILSRDAVTLSDVEGQANGGTMYLTGALNHSGLRPTSGSLAITGRNLAMAIPEALKTEVNLDLTLALERGALSLSGDATVLGGSYREPISLATGLLQTLQASPAIVSLEAPSAVDAMVLDIRVTTGEDIYVDNNYGKLALGADVRLGGTVAQPTLIGRAEAREGGRIFLGGNVYQVVGRGAINFSDPTRIEPDLAITALTRVAGYGITLNLNGPPATLDTTLTSDPPLSQGEIVSLLVTGQAQNAGAMAISSTQVIGYLSGEVLGVTGRALGLDALRYERGQDVRFDAGLVAGETDPASRLTFGKQVARQVEVVFSQSLKDSGKLTWILGYRPRPNIELRFVSQDNERYIYNFRHDVTIGDRARSAAPARGPVARVASVAFTGTHGLPEPELRRHLRLTEGSVFDFFRWQQDRDRLEAALRADGHFEARVSAGRSGSQAVTAATIDLTYDVYRGPRTIVQISGIPPDRTLEAELERLWGQAVFDGFLLDEARRAAQAALIRDGFLRAAVTSFIERREGADEKRLVVSVQPGPRSSSLRLLFSGQEHVSAGRLDELARDRQLGASAWVDPAPLVRAITSMYRNEGFLDASVFVGPPAFDGDTATRPVIITEGPQFHLETVAFAGARLRPAAALEHAFPLQPGAVLTRAAADRAVQALSSAYRADGFNTVRVTLTSEATRASGLVALTVSVDEGRRQVLRDIAVEGARRTNPALVSRELRLDVGQPVDLAAWAQARRRLYDTSVFRQVDIHPVPIDEVPAGGPPQAEQPVLARVTLDEWPPLKIRYGFELDDERKPASETVLRPGVAADLTYRNVFGRAASTGLAVRWAKDFEAARGFFSKPSFLGLPLTSTLFLERSREHLGVSTERPYVTDKSEFTVEQRFKTGRRLQVAYSYNFQRNHTFDAHVHPDDPLAFDIAINIAKLTTTAFVDTRDDLVDATRGGLLSSTFEYGVDALGSDLRFAKYFVQQNYYRSLGRGLVFATSGRLGLGAGYDQELIRSERFFAGGGNSVRGFDQDSLGPVDVFGDPAGGNALLVFNEEIRFPIVWRFRGVGFFDAGNVFATIGDLALRGMRAGAGVGLRVQTPFALFRADLGAPLAAKAGESRVRWFFSIGQTF